MGKTLTEQLVLSKSKCENLYAVKNLNLWGNEIEDMKLLRNMPNVEVLSLSVNKIISLKEFQHCSKLQELYLRKNNIQDLREIKYLQNLKSLKVLWLWDNPCADTQNYRDIVIKILPNLIKLDNSPVTPDEVQNAKTLPLNPDFNEQTEQNNSQLQENRNILNQQQIPHPVLHSQSLVQKKLQQNSNKKLFSENMFDKNNHQTEVSQKSDQNSFHAIMLLMNNLDNDQLSLIKREIEKKLV